MTGWLESRGSSSHQQHSQVSSVGTSYASDAFRVGAGTGVFGLGSPRAMEFGLKVTF